MRARLQALLLAASVSCITLTHVSAAGDEADNGDALLQTALEGLLLLEPNELAQIQHQAANLRELKRALSSDSDSSSLANNSDCRAKVLNATTTTNATIVPVSATRAQLLVHLLISAR